MQSVTVAGSAVEPRVRPFMPSATAPAGAARREPGRALLRRVDRRSGLTRPAAWAAGERASRRGVPTGVPRARSPSPTAAGLAWAPAAVGQRRARDARASRLSSRVDGRPVGALRSEGAAGDYGDREPASGCTTFPGAGREMGMRTHTPLSGVLSHLSGGGPCSLIGLAHCLLVAMCITSLSHSLAASPGGTAPENTKSDPPGRPRSKPVSRVVASGGTSLRGRRRHPKPRKPTSP